MYYIRTITRRTWASVRHLGGGSLLVFVLSFTWPALLADNSGPVMVDSALLAAIRLVDAHTWTLTDDSDALVAQQTLAFDVSSHEGRIYSGVAPGGSVVAVPYYWLLRPVFSRFSRDVITNRRITDFYDTNAHLRRAAPSPLHLSAYLLQIALTWGLTAPLFALFCTMLWQRLVREGLGASRALAVTAAASIATMTFYYSCMFSGQALAYLMVWLAVLLLSERGLRRDRTYVLAGLLAGGAVSIEYPSAMLVGLWLCFLVPRLSWRQRALLVAPLVVIGAGVALYHDACFGAPWSTPYHHRFWDEGGYLASRGIRPTLQKDVLVGGNLPDLWVVLRLCFGSYKGLFVHCPILLLGLVGHLRGSWQRTNVREHAAALLVFAAYLLYNSTLGTHDPRWGHVFWGSSTAYWGPRYLFAVQPFLAVGLLALDWSRPWVPRVVYPVLALSVAENVLASMFKHITTTALAITPEPRSQIPYVLHLVLERGPRLTLLDAYDVGAGVQTGLFVALVVASIASVRALRRADP